LALGKITPRLSSYLPRLGLSSLILCLGSGIILTFYYRPVGNVFQNVEEITTLVPYGWFFRQLHYGAGQLFVILMLIHTMDHFLNRRYRTYSPGQWSLLIFSLCLCFFTLFTGFILKGDKEGFFAGQIFTNILKTVPFIGERLANLFIVPGESFFFLPYLYHCFFLPLLIIYLIRAHIREWLPDQKFLFLSTIGLVLYALLVAPQVDIPPEAPLDLVKGPWFFLGIQTLLKGMPPLWAGLVVPGLLLGCLFILPLVGTAFRRALHYLVMVSFIVYATLTLRATIWGP
jgi:ubiquinol-cytochrome c reductase cytochrome b subunit